MKSFRALNFKEKMEYIGILAIYPLILLYEQIGKSVKFLNSRSKQITASILTVCLMLTMIPVISITASATTQSITEYDLWVGGVQVTEANAYDIFNDGTTRYDADTGTLFLDDANITTLNYDLDDYFDTTLDYAEEESVIFSAIPSLTIRYYDTNILGGNIVTYADEGTAAVTLKGSEITDTLTVGAVEADVLTVEGKGTVSATAAAGGEKYCGVYAVDITVKDGAVLIASSEYAYTPTAMGFGTMNAEDYIATDENGDVLTLVNFYGSGYLYVKGDSLANDFSNIASYVKLAPAPVSYVQVGGVQVTDDNASDILGDGKASFDAATNTLTISGDMSTSGYGEKVVNYTGIEKLNIYVTENAAFTTVQSSVIDAFYGKIKLTIADGKKLSMTAGAYYAIRAKGIEIVGGSLFATTTRDSGYYVIIGTDDGILIKDSNVEVTSSVNDVKCLAAYENGDIIIDNSTVKAVANGDIWMGGVYGIYVCAQSHGKLIVKNDSEVYATGTSAGVYVRSSVEAEGFTITASTTAEADETACTETPTLSNDHYCIGEEKAKTVVFTPSPHTHNNITFDKEWTATSGNLTSGNYYLTESNAETLNADITVPENEEVILCLNGNTLDMGTGWFRNNGTLTICDCSAEETGKITSSGDRCFENKGILNVISGTVENTKKNGFCINGGTNSIVNLSGGKFVADWGVTSNGTVYLSGAPIFDCSSVDLGCLTNGVIYAQSNDTIPIAYSGEALLLNLITPVTVDKTVVKNITAANSNLFSINNTGYFLKQSGVDLVVDKTHTHDNITFDKEWTAKSGELASGNYYLTESNAKKLTENITIPEGATVNLCLNGNTLNLGSKTIINNGTLNIYDCGEGRIITDINSTTLGAIANNGTLTINEGTTVQNTHPYASTTIVIHNGGTFTLNSGNILADGGNGISNAEGGVAEIKGTSTVTAKYCPLKNYGKFTLTKGELTCVSGNSTGVYNGSDAKFIMVDGTINAATGLGNHGDAQISGGMLQGDITGIDNYDTLNITASTVTGSVKYGIQNYSSATATVSTGTTVSGLEYGIHNSGILYLCNKPSISGDDTNHADIYYNSGSIYAKNSNGSLLYTGDALTVKVYNPENNIGSVIINKVSSSINNDKFSVVNEDYFLKQSNTDLILAKLHKHNGMTFTEWDNAYSLPTTAGNYCLATDIVNRSGASFTAPSGNTNICLNGHTITTSTDNPLINVPNNANLSIYDCNTDKVRYGQWKSGSYLLSDTAPDGEYDTITGGILSGGYFYASAGAVNVWGGGVFNLYSGTLAGNSSGSGGGAVNVGEESTFNMYGGKIAYNKSNSGGGVYVEDGTFNMYGGSITNNTASTNGDAIYIDSGTVSISGGTVKGTDSYGIYGGRGNIYLSGTPEISGSSDIYRYGCKIYAHANGDINDVYSGNPLTIEIRNNIINGVVVYEINDNNAEKFSLAEGSTQTLVRVGDNLIVDGTAPTGEISIGTNHWNEFLNTITFGLFFKETQSVTITADDNFSGVKEIAYYLANGEMTKEQLNALQSTDWTVDDEFNINPENKYIIYAKITDEAGNVTYVSTNGIVLFTDTEITTGEYEYTLTTKTDIVTNIKPGNNTVNMIDICEPGGNAGDMLDYFINSDGYIVLKGESLEGFTKDWYAGDYTVTVMYNALGEEYVDGASKGDKINDTVITLTVKRFKAEKPTADSTVFTYNGSEQTYTVAESEYYTVSGNKRTNAGEQDVTVALKDTNTFEWADGTTDNLTFKFNIGKANPNVPWPNALVGNAGDKLSTVALESGFTWDNGDTVIVYSDNNYSMTYTPADTVNYNILKKDIKVNGLDVTFPTGEITLKDNKWNEFLNNITFGLFFKETQSIVITAADTESGVKEIAYYLATEELSIDDVKALESSKWTVYADAFNVEPDNKYVVYARITDNAGNVIYINSDGIVLDSIKPVIAGVEDGKDVYGDATFTVDEEYLDTVTLDGEPIEVKDGKYSVPADNKEHTIVVTDKTGNQVTYKLTVYKNYKVSFVVDGKEISSSEVGYGKDATLPEIPAKDGYTAKWDVDGKNITADTVITAVYEKIPESPKTSDNTNIWLWVALLFVSGFSLFGIVVTKKRKEQEAE